MTSFKIISQELYDHLTKHQNQSIHEFKITFQEKSRLIKRIQQMKRLSDNLQIRLHTEINKNSQQQQQIFNLHHQLKQLIEIKDQYNALCLDFTEKSAQKNETQKFQTQQNLIKSSIDVHSQDLLKKMVVLEQGLLMQNEKIIQYQGNIQTLQNIISQLNQNLKNTVSSKADIELKYDYQILQIEQLQKTIYQIHQRNKKLQLTYQNLKLNQQNLQQQLNQLKDSPSGLLQQALRIKDDYIAELTKEIDQLKDRFNALQCQLQQRPHRILPAKQSLDQIQRLKYIDLFKNLLVQFKSRVRKIQLQKKTAEQKYKNIKIKINDYQYNQFKYQDKLSLYMEKIQKYQKLAERQHNQMEKIIGEFDHQLNNVLKTKENQIKSKLINQLYTNQDIKRKQSQTESQLQDPLRQDQYPLRQNQNPLRQDQESLREQLQSTKQQLKKAIKSKKKRSQQLKILQQQCYRSSLQLRRYKYISQQLLKQIQIKINQNQLLKQHFHNGTNSYKGSHKSGDQLIENLSLRLSDYKNNVRDQADPIKNSTDSIRNSADCIRNSAYMYQYQISQVDHELQTKHKDLLGKISYDRTFSRKANPGEPGFDLQFKKKSSNQPSELSSRSSNNSSYFPSSQNSNNSPSSSISSYKSYGISNLYTQKQCPNDFDKALIHKISTRR